MAASRAELQRVEGIGPKCAESVLAARDDARVDTEIDRAARAGMRIVCIEDEEFPRPLCNTPDSPNCLYVRGRLEPADAVAVAIVGTRRCSHYGREQAIRFGEALAAAGFTIVSGLARGIDAFAHRGALQARGRTIAVLGNGLPAIYPPEHESLADEIAACGALVTESPMHTAPSADSFPRRNRIIAGLALGVIVIEAGKRSGALITARLATEYNREVFALPGRVDQPDITAGVNALIRDGGAKLITCLDDVLDELAAVGEIMRKEIVASSVVSPEVSDAPTAPDVASKLTADEAALLGILDDGECAGDDLCARSGMEPGRVLALLTSLELKGRVRRLAGNRFARRTR